MTTSNYKGTCFSRCGLVLLFLMAGFAIQDQAAAQQTDVLYVYNADENTGQDGKNEDFRFLEILEDELGFNVVTIHHQLSKPADADGMDVVFISESVWSGEVADKFKNVDVPVVISEVFAWDDMAMIKAGLAVDVEMGYVRADKINVSNTDHPLLGGLRPGEVTVYSDPPEGEDNQIGYAVPVESAEVVATLPSVANFGGNPLSPSSKTRATLFTLDAGATLDDGSAAAARRVGFYAHRGGNENPSEIGEKLFINSILWALGREAEIPATEAPAPSILFVLNSDDNTGQDGKDEDFQYLEILEDELGFNVQTVHHQLSQPADTAGMDAIFISESVWSGEVADKFKGVRMPVVNAEVFTWDDVQWIPQGLPVDVDMGFGNASSIQVAHKTHPILGGAETFELKVYDDPPAGEGANQIGYAVPTADAEILATLSASFRGPDGQPLPPSSADRSRATLFVLEPGDQLEDGTTVWARRASFFAHRNGSENLSETGKKLFINTILWAVGREAEVRPIEAETPSILVVLNSEDNTGQDGKDEDFRYLELLEDSLGFDVVVVDHKLSSRADTAGVSAIFISESVWSGEVADKFAGVQMPVINAEVFTWDDVMWIEPGLAVDTDMGFAASNTINVTDTDHPILRGLSPGALTVFNDPPAGEGDNKVGYAVAMNSAAVLATIPDDAIGPDGNPLPASDNVRASLFAYERGDTLVSSDTLVIVAPARRVGFFAHRDGSENMTEAGEQLFMNAVAWATGREVEVRSITTVSNERVTELPNSFAIESVYPNPFNPSATVALQIREAGPYEVNVYDVLGRLVQKHAFSAAPGQQHVSLEMHEKASGMYLIQVVQTQTGKAAMTRAVLLK